MRKKKKLRKWVKLLFAVISLILLGFAITVSLPKDLDKKDNNEVDKIEEKKPSITEIVIEKLKDNNISDEFINWVNDTYPSSLYKLNTYLEEKDYDETLWHDATGFSYKVLNDLFNKKYDSMDNVKILESKEIAKMDFVGDVSLADNWAVAPQYDKRGKKVLGILSQEVVNIMTLSDFMVVNSEFTVSNRGKAMNGKQYTFRAKPERLNIYHEMGVDLALLANNHVYDFGKDAFLDMFEAFKKVKIPYIGAGRNLEEAMKPYYVIINGYKVAILNASRAEKYRLTPGATNTTPGIFLCYDTTNMVKAIKKAKEESDYVISIIHFGKELYHTLEKEQVSSAKLYIDSGSDMVIGHHAHVLQGVEIYKDKPIIYNLGNFIFNAITVDTAIFEVRIDDKGNMEYYMIPAIQKAIYTSIANDKDKARIIKDINSWSINAYLDSNGKILKK